MSNPSKLVSLLVLTACGGGAESTAPPATTACGDVDGSGGDTGDVPDVLGAWTASFASSLSEDGCALSGTLTENFGFLNQPFDIAGAAPYSLRLEPSGLDDTFYGNESATGGLVFSGQTDASQGLLNIAFGGLLYTDPYTGRTMWEGMVFLGVDQNKDGGIDCTIRGDWTAIRSSN